MISMSMQSMPPGGTTAALQFSDAASCARWVAALPITNVQMVQQMLSEQVGALAIVSGHHHTG